MKRAFTLIELLVVIAIIAILAAILFPVFAQARQAALQTAAISGQKQIATAAQLYINDTDGMLPRNDDCQPNSSLNPALNVNPFNAVGVGCTAPPFYYRVNHFSWQKWLMPYMKSVDIFFHPTRGRLDRTFPGPPFNNTVRQWSGHGQIMGSFALNLALGGALNTYGDGNRLGAFRNSWLGGNISSIPSPSRAMYLFEYTNPNINYSPTWQIGGRANVETHGPMAVREFWAANFLRPTDIATCTFGTDPDPSRTTYGQIIVGFADSSARAIPVNRFLAMTPTAAEIGAVVTTGVRCGVMGGVYFEAPAGPNFAAVRQNPDYAFWALD